MTTVRANEPAVEPVAVAGTAVEDASAPALLEVRDLWVTFNQRGRKIRAVQGVTYSVRAGETLAIIGESGSGKTVSSRAVLGLFSRNALVSGSVRFQGLELVGLPEKQLRAHRGPDMAMVFQDPARSLDPTMRVGSQITESIRAHMGLSRKAAMERGVELLNLVRLPSPRARFFEYPHQLSGGMRQRVMIAIALACHPKLLIADEATTALDVTTQAQIMDLLQELKRELNMSLIMISHDLGLAASYTDQVVVMYAGKVVEQAPTRKLFASVRMPYTKVLLDAIPRLSAAPHAPFPMVPGRPPDLSSLPPGCAFHPRCPVGQDDCMEGQPPLELHEADHLCACFHPMIERQPTR